MRTILVAALLLLAPAARAELGGAPLSDAAAARGLAAVRAGETGGGGCTVHHLVTAAGAVREFARPDGTVFAVAWEGHAPPDLAAVLGAYAAEVKAAFPLRARAPGRGAEVRSANVILQTWGHMRALHGRAWVPALVPAEVNLDDVR
ncbi:MAG: DUF2844 domain-containing protein [Anaeromyxobacter sp.]